MNRTVVLGLGNFVLLFAGCAKLTESAVERRFVMPDSLGAFVIRLDSNLTPLHSGVSHSDDKCGDQLYQLYTMRSWPDSVDSPLDISKDSLFQFTWLIDRYTPVECDSAQTVREWLNRELDMRRIECTVCSPVNSGIVMVNDIPWAFIQTSNNMIAHNDAFMCYTRRQGRGVQLGWQRVAPSAVRFDFGAYARRQLATAKFD